MEVSVEAALRRGSVLLKGIPAGLFLFCMLLPVGLSSMELTPVWGIAVGFPAGIVAAWLWWSFASTRWRIWAFTHVRNIRELMDLAVKDKLVWPEGSWFGRTEIRTRAQREMLQQLAVRMEMPVEVRDDPTVPNRTLVHYSIVQYIFLLVMGLPLLGFGAYMALQGIGDGTWSALLMVAVGAWLVFDAARKLLDCSTRITISREGIALAGKGTFAWGVLWDEQIITIGTGRSSRTVLKFWSEPLGMQEIGIDNLKTSKAELRHALKIHRHRWTLDQPADRDWTSRS